MVNQENWYESINHAEDDQEDDESESDGDDCATHPRPCDCGNFKCIIIKAALERYKKEEEARMDADMKTND